VPNAAEVLGTAVGSVWLGALMARRGHRSALSVMYGLAAAGGLAAFVGVLVGSLVPVLLGLGLVGLGNSAANLSRYAAADLYPPARRGFALSVVVWAGTAGALLGPTLIAPAAAAADRLGLPPLSGPMVVAALLSGLAMLVSTTLPDRSAHHDSGPAPTWAVLVAGLRRPVVAVPLSAMVGAHVAMELMMTVAPLHVHAAGGGLDVVGLVISAHMVGMFVLAPVSGRLADRWGGTSTIVLGIALLAAAAATVVAAPTEHTAGTAVPLFLLGFGWNLVFVGGSARLSRDLPADQQSQLQGMVDAVVWGVSVVASVASGVLFQVGGYPLVAVAAGIAATAPLLLLHRRVGPPPSAL
jgi:MFS family permease